METHRIVKQHYRGYEVTLSALGSRILTILDKYLPEASLIEKQKAQVGSDLSVLNQGIGRTRKSAFTIKIKHKDGNRDTLYQALVRRVESDMLRIDDPIIAANADALNTVIEENGKAMARGYLDQTTQLENLFGKLTTEQNTQFLNENNLKGLFDALVASQNEFRDIWTASIESESDKEIIIPLREAADTLMNRLNRSLFKRLDIGAEDFGESYTKVITMINQAVDQAAKVQRARIARNDTTDEPVTEEIAS